MPDNLIVALFIEKKMHIFQKHHVAGIQADPVFTHGAQATLRALGLVLRKRNLSLDSIGHLPVIPLCNCIPACLFNKSIRAAAVTVKQFKILQFLEKGAKGGCGEPFSFKARYTGPAQTIGIGVAIYPFIDYGGKMEK
jgi:hypothetical protein